MKYVWRFVVTGLLCAMAALLAYLQTPTGSYLANGALGHIRILAARQPIEDLLARRDLDPDTRQQLRLVQEVRAFAVERMGLKEGKGYTSLVEIDSDYPGWNVYAAPRFSTEAHRWCFPLAGCVVYRGYFSRDQAAAFAKRIAAEEQLDIHLSPFIGYSSLGYLPDPLLTSQLRLSPSRLAALVIHELAHQRLYIPGKSKVNEAFARVVEREGVKLWLVEKGETDRLEAIEQRWQAGEERAQAVIDVRDRLTRLYASGLDKEQQLQRKGELLLELQKHICGTKCQDMTSTTLNNASLIPYVTYSEELGSMYRLFEQAGKDFEAFYRLVEATYVR